MSEENAKIQKLGTSYFRLGPQLELVLPSSLQSESLHTQNM